MLGADLPTDRERKVRIVIFSGGRGSSVVTKEVLADSRNEMTLAING
jgi:7-cyano-7-deazaguanine synthase in queuosine biosynthesis